MTAPQSLRARIWSVRIALAAVPAERRGPGVRAAVDLAAEAHRYCVLRQERRAEQCLIAARVYARGASVNVH